MRNRSAEEDFIEVRSIVEQMKELSHGLMNGMDEGQRIEVNNQFLSLLSRLLATMRNCAARNRILQENFDHMSEEMKKRKDNMFFLSWNLSLIQGTLHDSEQVQRLPVLATDEGNFLLSKLKNAAIMTDSECNRLQELLVEEKEARNKLSIEASQLESRLAKLNGEIVTIREELMDIGPRFRSIVDAAKSSLHLNLTNGGSTTAVLSEPLCNLRSHIVAYNESNGSSPFSIRILVNRSQEIEIPYQTEASSNVNKAILDAVYPALEAKIECNCCSTAFLTFYYLKTLGVVTINVRVMSSEMKDSEIIAMERDTWSLFIEDHDMLDSIVPTQISCRICDDEVSGYGGLSSPFGHCYVWLQRLAGLIDQPDSINFPKTIIDKVRKRINSRLDLYTQVSSFRQLKIDLPSQLAQKLPRRLRSTFCGWEWVSPESFTQHPMASLLEKLEHKDGWIFLARYKYGHHLLTSAIHVNRFYPYECCNFRMKLWSEKASHQKKRKESSWIKDMELYVSVDCLDHVSEELSNFALAFQLKVMQSCFDVILECGFHISHKKGASANYHSYSEHGSFRKNYSLPFTYDPDDKCFS